MMIVEERLNLENTREAFEKKIKHSAASLVCYSKEAFEHFTEVGYPTPKQEDWKYINLDKIVSSKLSHNIDPNTNHQDLSIDELIQSNIVKECKESSIVLIDGVFSKKYSTLTKNISSESGRNVFVDSIQNALAEGIYSSQCQKYFNQIKEQDSFSLLNTSFVSAGLFVFIPNEVELAQPAQILLVSSGKQVINYPRLLIASGKHSRAQILIKSVGLNDCSEEASNKENEYLNNVVNEVYQEENSKLNITYLQKEADNSMQIALTSVDLEKDTQFDLHSFSFGGTLTRHKIIASINGEGASCNLNGLYKTHSNHASHNQVVLNHNAANASSSQLFKGVLDDSSKAEFSGTINVAKNAVGTDAQQLNRNLLLSPTAKVDTRPQLQIDTDDVKCSHGATTGQIDEEQVFYLMSRGFDKNQAVEILTKAFAEEIILKSPFAV